jgi:hypothetical protein
MKKRIVPRPPPEPTGTGYATRSEDETECSFNLFDGVVLALRVLRL